MTAINLLLCAAVSFGQGDMLAYSGDDYSELAAVIGKRFNEPVAIMFDPAFPKIEFNLQAESREGFRARLGNVVGLKSAPGLPLGIARAAWPKESLYGSIRQGFAAEFRRSKPDILLEGGKVTAIAKRREFVTAERLEGVKWSKPFKTHWFYRYTPVAVYADRVDEKSFLLLLALSMGARFVETPEEYRFDFDPGTMRTRAAGLFTRLSKGSEENYEGVDSAFRAEAYKAASDQVLRSAFATESSESAYVMGSGGPLYMAADQRVRSRNVRPQGGRGGRQQSADANQDANIRGRVDVTKPIQVVIRASGLAILRFSGRGRNSGSFIDF